MRISRWCLLLMVAAIPGLAQDESASHSRAGTVINSVTGAPIPRVLISIEGTQNRLALTDENGRFQLDGIADAEPRMSVRKRGFFSSADIEAFSTGNLRGAVSLESSSSNDDDSHLLFKLVPAASLHGRVTSESGIPLERVPITLFFYGSINGENGILERGHTDTDDFGEFRFDELFPGDYFVEAGPLFASDELMPVEHSRVPAIGYVMRFYPGVEDPHSATPISVTPGQDVEANITLPETPLFSISGQVTTPRGEPLQRIALIPEARGAQFHIDGEFEDAQHRFTFSRVPPGRYQLEAVSANAALAGQAVDVRSDISNLSLSVQAPSAGIPIVVHSTNAPYPGPQSRVNLSLRPRDPWMKLVSSYYSLTGNMAEEYLQVPAAGSYDAQFWAGFPFGVVAATCGRTDLLREPLVVSGGSIPPIEITVTEGTATLNGRVPVQRRGASVLIVPGDSFALAQVITLDHDGYFGRPFLAPGSYRVWAFDHLPSRFKEAGPMAPYLAKAVTVTLGANEKREIIIPLTSKEEER